MVENPNIESLIYLFRHYENQANKCFEIYDKLEQAYFMYDYYMEMASIYEIAILAHI